MEPERRVSISNREREHEQLEDQRHDEDNRANERATSVRVGPDDVESAEGQGHADEGLHEAER